MALLRPSWRPVELRGEARILREVLGVRCAASVPDVLAEQSILHAAIVRSQAVPLQPEIEPSTSCGSMPAGRGGDPQPFAHGR